MFWKILKKDLKRKKAMNIILLMFIILCSMFLGSSISSIFMTNGALAKFAEMSGTADYYINTMDATDINDWLKNSSNVTNYEKTVFLAVEKENIRLDGKVFDGGQSTPFLAAPSKNYNLAFDENDKLIASIEDGECCISRTLAEKNGADIGDQLNVTIGSVHRTLTIVHITKDYVFGSDYFLINRVLISQNDYDVFAAEGQMSVTMWSISSNDTNKLINEKNRQSFAVMFEFTGDSVAMTYYMEQIASVTMLIAAVVLIVVSLTLLRFTIRTTIEDDYREIGVMKAIGLKGSGVRGLYTVKYLAISLVGAALGALVAIPFTEVLTESLRKKMVIGSDIENNIIFILCAIAVIAIAMLFCRFATDKVRHMTAIQAIREGSSGERFKRRGILRLKGKKRGSVPLFMASNDILSALRSYMIIFIALVAVLQLIILPFNALSILENGSIMAPYFAQEVADLYADPTKQSNDIAIGEQNYDKLVDYVQGLEEKCAKEGIDVKINQSLQFSSQVYVKDQYDQIGIQAWKQTNGKPVAVPYTKGSPPVLANEIAMSETAMQKFNVTLGEKVHMVFGDDNQEYIITGSFQSMTNMGDCIVLSPRTYPDMSYCVMNGFLQFTFNQRDDIAGQTKKLKEVMPGLDFMNADDFMFQMLEDTVVSMRQMINMMIVIGLIITVLVIFLIGHTLLSKDKGNAALLKSIGFRYRSLRVWQTARIAFTALTATIFGVFLSFALNPLVTKLTFGLMGADSVPPNIDAVYVFGIFPGMFIVAAAFTGYVVSRGVKKIDMRNVGNLE